MNEARIENASVLVEGNIIKPVSTDAIEAPGATVIDGEGRTPMPGIIDAHTQMNLMTCAVGMEMMPLDEIGVRSTVMARDWLND